MGDTDFRMGLRFKRAHARLLDNLADRFAGEAIATEQVTLFRQAATSAREGEPLVVLCGHPAEVEQMAAAFVLWGLPRPAVEDLNARAG